MTANWKITYFRPMEQGVTGTFDCVRFAADIPDNKKAGIILYTSDHKEVRYPFSEQGKSGSLYGIQIEGKDIHKCLYNFYIDDEIINDPYAKMIHGLEAWGESNGSEKRKIYGGILVEPFDWGEDIHQPIAFEDSILYGLNVRAFTMDKSSGVRHKGTFEGIIEKIPYFKELGVTTVELMPCYEYDECIHLHQRAETITLEDTLRNYREEESKVRLNCWGFQEGFYFAPKSSYSAVNMPVQSFKTMVRELHQNGLEIILQFYFPKKFRQCDIRRILCFWVQEYHIDGFRINGFHIPYRLLLEEPVLSDTKLWLTELPVEEMADMPASYNHNIAKDNFGFREDCRRFLKGDEGLINQILHYQRCHPSDYSVINYIADYDGFSLYDYVAYEHKHNEANGEDNQDGSDFNYSWNCGVEGDTRRKSVLSLRMKQQKNALSMVFLSQGIPFLFSGDEFSNTRFGNNNAYCQDNEIGWVKWKQNQYKKEIFSYTKYLISLRKAHKILHMSLPLQLMDAKGCGYPDISYHGMDAWRPDLSYTSRTVGIILCGQYAPDAEEDSFYIAINMHWEAHSLALPKLSKGIGWYQIMDSMDFVSNQQTDSEAMHAITDDKVVIAARSICIYQSGVYKEKGKKHRSKRK